MTFAEKKEYLCSYRNAMLEINTLEEEIEKLSNDAVSIKAVDYSKDKVQTSPSDPMVEYVIKKESLVAKLERLQTEKIKEYHRVNDAIESLDNIIYRTILRRRYLLSADWEEISSIIHYEKTRMFELHAEAISALDL